MISKSSLGRIKLREKAALARKHQPALSRFFRKQGLMVLDRLDTLQQYITNKDAALPKGLLDDWNRIWDRISDDTLEELQDLITDAEQEGLEGGERFGGISLNDLSRTFDVKNPRAVQFFKEHGGSVDYIRGINDTTSELVKGVIGQGLDKGQSYNQIAKGIRSEFAGMSRERATRIAVFETGAAYEQGNKIFAQELQDEGTDMEEQWMTSHDERVRPEHAANEAEGWVPIGHVYSSGDTDVPTDPGCRCYKIFREVPK